MIYGLRRKDPFLFTLVEGYPCRSLIAWLHQFDAMQVAYKILATWLLQDCLLMLICTVLMMSAGLRSRKCGNGFVRGEDSAGGHPPRKLNVPAFHRDQTYRYALLTRLSSRKLLVLAQSRWLACRNESIKLIVYPGVRENS